MSDNSKTTEPAAPVVNAAHQPTATGVGKQSMTAKQAKAMGLDAKVYGLKAGK